MSNKLISKKKNGNLSAANSFNDFLRPWDQWLDNSFLSRTLTTPAVNVSENDKGYTLSVAVPGLKKEDFQVDVYGNVLTISAEKEEQKEEKEKDYTRQEYNYSSFSRSFTLPDEVKHDAINAEYKDGVLSIVLPKTTTTKAGKTVKIN